MFSVFSPIHAAAPTCQYYRVTVPLKSFEQHNCLTSTPAYGTPREMWLQNTFQADAVQLYLPSQLDLWHQVLDSAKMMSAIQAPDGTKYPPIFIWDGDDNPDFTSPFNQSFVVNGTRNVDGSPIKPGAILETTAGDGTKVPMWKDKETTAGGLTFDIARNIEQERLRKSLIRKCHGATACSPELASYYRDALGQKNVHVYYNTVVPEDYQYGITPHRRAEGDNTVRIFWQGGQSHLHDWLPLQEAVRTVARRYPNTKWIFMGVGLPFLEGSIPAEQVEVLPWIHYEAYRLRRTLVDADINLCPLMDNVFNRCKSAIKWYESTVSENVEATLAQNVGPYREIKDGETGLLFNTADEFVLKLSALIEDAQLRLRLGHAAKDWVWNNRLPKHTGPALFEFYRDLKDRQMAELSPKIITTIPRSLKEVVGGNT